jgi:dihydroflavonol-4-reductase
VRRATDGIERVFHVAGRTSLRAADREAVFDANLRGARIVFEEALRAGVERLVHTSSVGAIGVAKPHGTADETTPFEIGHLGLAYVNSKHEAELEALHLAARGLPVVIVNPTFVLGPDDPTGTSMGLVRRFLLRQIPIYVNGGLNIVDVRDVATGHLLADEKGEVGERYILGGRNFTLDRLFADLSRISGVPPPELRLPAPVAVAGAEAAHWARLPIATVPDEVRSASLWWTYRSGKARQALGFRARPHEQTLEEAVAWQREQLGGRQAAGGLPRLALRATGRLLGGLERIAGR